MSEPTRENIVSIVSSYFYVTNVDFYDNTLELEISDSDFQQSFVHLAQRLENENLLARIEQYQDGRTVILINQMVPQKQRRWWIPIALLGVVITLVMIDGYFRTQMANEIVDIGEPLGNAVFYTASLVGILGVHELGHLVAAKKHNLKTSWPYFIPGIPVFAVPTFGALIMSRGLFVNRNILFDVAIAGPIAGLVIAVIVSFFGAFGSPTISDDAADQLRENAQLVDMKENIIMKSTFWLAGKSSPDVEVIMTPVMFAAWLGFLITFLNLLPAWQLDGGHMARAILGRRNHQIATYASIGLLALLGFWPMALFILIFSMKAPDPRPLDDISPLSKNRKKLFLVVIVLAVLCAPLPSFILG